MILVHVLVKVGIIAGAVILFLVTFLLNKKTKAPKIDESIKKCATCTNESCIIKMTDIEEIKKEFENELNKDNKNLEKQNDEEIKNEIIETLKSCQENKGDKKNEE